MLLNISKNWNVNSKYTFVKLAEMTCHLQEFRLSSEKVEDELQDQFIDMKNDSSCQDLFEAFPVTDFWLRAALSNPEISKTALKKVLPFSSTWLCESAFSTLLNVKTKQRNRLEI